MIVTKDSTNITVPFYFVDDVGGTNPGEPTTGLLFSDIETGGSASYQRQGAARVDFTLVTQTAAGAHTDGGFVLVDDTEMPGVYRCDIPDAAVATGVDFVIIYLRAAAAKNTITRPLKIDLIDVPAKGIKKNTAYNNIPFLMVDSTDHTTPKTGLTIVGTRSIDGGAYGSVTGTFAEVANGTYQLDASAADLNGDTIMFRFTGTAADDVFVPIVTTP